MTGAGAVYLMLRLPGVGRCDVFFDPGKPLKYSYLKGLSNNVSSIVAFWRHLDAGPIIGDIANVKRQTRFIQYPSQHDAFHFLDEILADRRGAGLLHGPEVAGKSDLIEQIAHKVSERAAVAVVDGARLKPTAFLATTLTEYGYELGLSSADELLSMLSVFAVQQARSREAPVLIIENFNRMYPSCLHVLCKLALLRVNERFALRLVLVGDCEHEQVVNAPNMAAIADRLCGAFQLQPLTARESLVYLYARLQALGIEHPDTVFAGDVGKALHEATAGWPGKLDDVAEALVARADQFPLELEVALADCKTDSDGEDAIPELIVSYNGVVTARIRLVRDRYLLGRSELSDIILDNRFISKHHALLVSSGYGLVLVDMKSRNGTFVNSERIHNRILQNNDIVSLGDYRIKVICPAAYMASLAPVPELADTAQLQNIDNARSAKPGDRDLPQRANEKSS